MYHETDGQGMTIPVRLNRSVTLRQMQSSRKGDLAMVVHQQKAESSSYVKGVNKAIARNMQKDLNTWYREQSIMLEKLNRCQNSAYENWIRIERIKEILSLRSQKERELSEMKEGLFEEQRMAMATRLAQTSSEAMHTLDPIKPENELPQDTQKHSSKKSLNDVANDKPHACEHLKENSPTEEEPLKDSTVPSEDQNSKDAVVNPSERTDSEPKNAPPEPEPRGDSPPERQPSRGQSNKKLKQFKEVPTLVPATKTPCQPAEDTNQKNVLPKKSDEAPIQPKTLTKVETVVIEAGEELKESEESDINCANTRQSCNTIHVYYENGKSTIKKSESSPNVPDITSHGDSKAGIDGEHGSSKLNAYSPCVEMNGNTDVRPCVNRPDGPENSDLRDVDKMSCSVEGEPLTQCNEVLPDANDEPKQPNSEVRVVLKSADIKKRDSNMHRKSQSLPGTPRYQNRLRNASAAPLTRMTTRSTLTLNSRSSSEKPQSSICMKSAPSRLGCSALPRLQRSPSQQLILDSSFTCWKRNNKGTFIAQDVPYSRRKFHTPKKKDPRILEWMLMQEGKVQNSSKDKFENLSKDINDLEKFNPLDEVRRLYPQFYEKKPKAGSVDDRKSNILMTMIKAYGGINKYILDGVDPNSPEALKRCRYIRLKGQPIEVTDVSLTDLLDGKTSKVDNSESDKPIDKTEEHLPQI